LRISVVVAAPTGLHARPAIRLSRLAKQFNATVLVRSGDSGDWVDAKSIVRLMTLRVMEGGEVQFSVTGNDAERAIAELAALVGRNFNDVHGSKE
jgi:phosphocarrier protein HPr